MADSGRTRFLTDEDVPRSTARSLREAGYDAVDVRDVGLRGKHDQTVFEYAQKEGRILITCDLGFANTLAFPPTEHQGVIVVRIPDTVSIPAFNSEILNAITRLSDQLFHHLAILEIGRVRLRAN
jgi:predicted nuclease of predicted toxin-antitoxin system